MIKSTLLCLQRAAQNLDSRLGSSAHCGCEKFESNVALGAMRSSSNA